MNIQIIITDDNNKHVLTESVKGFDDARKVIIQAEFDHDNKKEEGNE